MLEDYPIRNESRENLVGYLCEVHNHANKRLGKPIFDCKKAFEYWGGDCGCDAKKEHEHMADNDYQHMNITDYSNK
jgi:hypothetical protein